MLVTSLLGFVALPYGIQCALCIRIVNPHMKSNRSITECRSRSALGAKNQEILCKSKLRYSVKLMLEEQSHIFCGDISESPRSIAYKYSLVDLSSIILRLAAIHSFQGQIHKL